MARSSTALTWFGAGVVSTSLAAYLLHRRLSRHDDSSSSSSSSSSSAATGIDAAVAWGSAFESAVGKTPLVYIRSLSEATGRVILAKAEFLNPGGSAKDRVARAIIRDAEARGWLPKGGGGTVCEGSSGSTAISLTMAAAAHGHKCYIVMPDDMAKEKSDLLERLGATVERVKSASIVSDGHYVNVARRRAAEIPGGFFADQFENLANFRAHYTTTGPEVWAQTRGRIDAFVMGSGTGGTIAGVARYIKERKPSMRVVLSDPQGSGLFNRVKYGVMYTSELEEATQRRHRYDTLVEGIGLARLTANFSEALRSPGTRVPAAMEDETEAGPTNAAAATPSSDSSGSCVDDAFKCSDQEAVLMTRYLARHDGVFVGSSAAVNCVAAVKAARAMPPGAVVVTLLCDGGSRHLTKFWNDEFLAKHGLHARLPEPEPVAAAAAAAAAVDSRSSGKGGGAAPASFEANCARHGLQFVQFDEADYEE